jgi:methanogenic corrinoid protein MtbC1
MSRTSINNPYAASLDNLPRAYFEPLIKGDRIATRQVIDEALAGGVDARELLVDLIWPTMELLQSLYREDRLSIAQLNMATRLNRSLTDQIAARLESKAENGRTVLIFCGDDEPEELGGQIAAELFEADGWTVRFAGGGVPQDEVLKLIGDLRPNLLCMFATLSSGVPGVRQLIDYLREVNSCPEMQVMCCGGIYKRAEGLAEEIGADLYASDASEAVKVANAHPEKRATVDQQTVGRTRRIRKAAARREGQAARATAHATTTGGADLGGEMEAA